MYVSPKWMFSYVPIPQWSKSGMALNLTTHLTQASPTVPILLILLSKMELLFLARDQILDPTSHSVALSLKSPSSGLILQSVFALHELTFRRVSANYFAEWFLIWACLKFPGHLIWGMHFWQNTTEVVLCPPWCMVPGGKWHQPVPLLLMPLLIAQSTRFLRCDVSLSSLLGENIWL